MVQQDYQTLQTVCVMHEIQGYTPFRNRFMLHFLVRKLVQSEGIWNKALIDILVENKALVMVVFWQAITIEIN